MKVDVRMGGILAALMLTNGQTVYAEGNDEPRAPHPEPRVVVNVLDVKGPHKPDRVQHDARFGWKRIVRCYKANGAKEPAVVTLELIVSGAGNVAKARGLVFEPKHRELAGCLAETLPGLSMPKADADSTVDVEIKLAPGDRTDKK